MAEDAHTGLQIDVLPAQVQQPTFPEFAISTNISGWSLVILIGLSSNCRQRVSASGLMHCDAASFACKSAQKESGPDETRTRDLRHARAALSRLSYGPVKPKQS